MPVLSPPPCTCKILTFGWNVGLLISFKNHILSFQPVLSPLLHSGAAMMEDSLRLPGANDATESRTCYIFCSTEDVYSKWDLFDAELIQSPSVFSVPLG